MNNKWSGMLVYLLFSLIFFKYEFIKIFHNNTFKKNKLFESINKINSLKLPRQALNQ